MNKIISLRNISKSFLLNKNIKVLKKINYDFKKGKIYSLMGPSGSGKSTLLNIISLIDKPTSGFIILDKNNVNFNNSSNNDKVRANKIGIVYQQNNLLPDFTALENIYLAKLSISNDKKKAVSAAENIINKMGLLKRKNHYPSELSGGEIQRFSIARALINEPDIILADEPTGSLDHETAKDVFKILYELKNPSRVIIYATHNRFFANMADCKLELIDGNIKTINAKNK